MKNLQQKIISVETAFCLVGILLMLGVILWSETINELIPISQPTIAEAMPIQAAPIATSTTSAPIASVPDENIDTIININDPRNYRVVPKDIMPGQAILEGKTTKFLLGF